LTFAASIRWKYFTLLENVVSSSETIPRGKEYIRKTGSMTMK
jgi:hypothetical protein